LTNVGFVAWSHGEVESEVDGVVVADSGEDGEGWAKSAMGDVSTFASRSISPWIIFV
jgi:hypothetical protein